MDCLKALIFVLRCSFDWVNSKVDILLGVSALFRDIARRI